MEAKIAPKVDLEANTKALSNDIACLAWSDPDHQIWTALIAMLLIRYLQLRSKHKWSLSNLVALLRMNLFVHKDLWQWINKPFDDPPQKHETTQHVLAFA